MCEKLSKYIEDDGSYISHNQRRSLQMWKEGKLECIFWYKFGAWGITVHSLFMMYFYIFVPFIHLYSYLYRKRCGNRYQHAFVCLHIQADINIQQVLEYRHFVQRFIAVLMKCRRNLTLMYSNQSMVKLVLLYSISHNIALGSTTLSGDLMYIFLRFVHWKSLEARAP